MRNITSRQFGSFVQNSWLAGLSQTEVLRELICVHDIEVTSYMEQALIIFYSELNREIDSFIPTLHSELRGH